MSNIEGSHEDDIEMARRRPFYQNPSNRHSIGYVPPFVHPYGPIPGQEIPYFPEQIKGIAPVPPRIRELVCAFLAGAVIMLVLFLIAGQQ